MIDYNRGTLLKWDDTTNEAFKTLVGLVDNCSGHVPLSILTFPTSAHRCSDFGIGILVQIIDGVEKPVAFISKSLVDSQPLVDYTKRSVPIYYCCKELDSAPGSSVCHYEPTMIIYALSTSSNNMIIRWFFMLMELTSSSSTSLVSRTLPMPCLDYAPIHALDMPKEYT
jgi:hypothetical protein